MKFVRRNRVAVALGSVAVVAVLGGIAGTWVQSARAAAERDFALRQLARAESVNDMNAFLLSDAAPLGRAFTAGDLLSRAEAAGQPASGRPAGRDHGGGADLDRPAGTGRRTRTTTPDGR